MSKTARIAWVEICGFRAFGTEPRRLTLDEPLVVIHAANSQGKTSTAEALEFLISGHCSRRELLGGAKAEYHGSLRNAYIPDPHHDVYIAAGIYGPDGSLHQVRRDLVRDFGSGSECVSRLTVDGVTCDDLADLGLPLADPPVRAPVLLQHTLRHVLSTEPKQRVSYFKSLLSINDLDVLRNRIGAARSTLEARPVGETLRTGKRLTGTAAGSIVPALDALADVKFDVKEVRAGVEQILLDAGTALLGEKLDSVQHLETALEAAITSSHESVYPLRAFSGSTPLDQSIQPPDLAEYSSTLSQIDREVARLAPLLNAVLALDEFADLDHPVDCPVCSTPRALTPARIAALRDELRRSSATDSAVVTATESVASALRDLDRLTASLSGLTPAVNSWSERQISEADNLLHQLKLDIGLSTKARSTAAGVARAVVCAEAAAQNLYALLKRTHCAVTAREQIPVGITDAYDVLTTSLLAIKDAHQKHCSCERALREAVEPAVRQSVTDSGSADLLHLVTHASQLVNDLHREAVRRRSVQRLGYAEKALGAASGKVLDKRFGLMSDTIAAWWNTIRPEERVGFAGMRRRAGGALFVNLIAALRSDPHGEAVERDALGIYSDSQLNALGLSIFLARCQLLGAPFVVLDDPIPGSDSDHRLTFTQRTLGALLDSGIQVILTTFDNKLAEWAQVNHDHRGIISYELTLADTMAGTEPIQTSDAFSRFMLEAEDNLNAPTARGRRAACGSYRSAAERLAKQIVATGRSHDGHPCSVADVHNEASTLGDLVPLVRGYALENDEKGQWRMFAKVLNPGNHDDDVPSTTELRQVRGNLRAIVKSHKKHWPNGLVM